VALLWKKFHVGDVPELEKVVLDQKLRDLPGVGEKSEENILKAIQKFKHLYGSARFHIHVDSPTQNKWRRCLKTP